MYDGRPCVAVEQDGGWVALGAGAPSMVRFLAADAAERGELIAAGKPVEAEPLLPFQPRTMRAFSLFERHHVQAARGLVRRYMPAPARAIVSAYERSGRTFPALKPKSLFYEEPSFYMGNPLTFQVDGEEVRWPGYANDLDFELELAFVITRELRDASLEEAERAIGGFVVVNDWSARDVQWRELRQGSFGPVVKTKTFANSMSADLVTAEEVLPRIDALPGRVRVNGELWAESSTAGMQHSPAAMVAHASKGETLRPGELFSTGTLPGCCGLELDRWIQRGDEVAMEIDGVATLANRIV